MSYITKQQQAVLHCLEQRAAEALTAAELAEDLHQAGESVGLATIYRQLDRLEQAGRIHKIRTADGACYQYCPHGGDDQDCLLLRCKTCGKVQHLECSHLQELYNHLEAQHNFRIDSRHTILTGQCRDCAEKEAASHAKHTSD